MSSSEAERTAALSWPVTKNVALRVAAPPLSEPIPDAELFSPDLSRIPGARIVLRQGLRGEGGLTLLVTCGKAPSDRWAPGVEDLVLPRVTAVALMALGGDVERSEVAAPLSVGPRLEQPFEAAVRKGPSLFAVHGRHVLGFTDEAREILLCSVMCAEPTEGSARCSVLVNAIQAEGAWSPPPPPSALVRAILLSAEHPLWALGLFGSAMLAILVFVLARRPRPRW